MSRFLLRETLKFSKGAIFSSSRSSLSVGNRSNRYFAEVHDREDHVDHSIAQPRAYWESKLKSYVRDGRRLRAHEVTRHMITDGHQLSHDNYHDLMKVNIRHNNLPLACELLERMETEGVTPTYQSLRILVLGFCRVGQLEAAVNMFETIFDHAAQIQNVTTQYHQNNPPSSASEKAVSVLEDRELVAQMVEWFGYFVDLEGLVDFVRVLYLHSVPVDEELLTRVRQLLEKDADSKYLLSHLEGVVQTETAKLQKVQEEKKQ